MGCLRTCSERSLPSARSQSVALLPTSSAGSLTRPSFSWFQSVPDAYVPVIKTAIAGVDLDFLFARVMSPTVHPSPRRLSCARHIAELSPSAQVPDDLDLSDDTILRGMDERCQRSLNGSSGLASQLLLDTASHTSRATSLRISSHGSDPASRPERRRLPRRAESHQAVGQACVSASSRPALVPL